MWQLGAYTEFGWRPGIGDPTLMGWVTVAAYLGAAWLCWRRAGAVRPDAASEHKGLRRPKRVRWFWLTMALLMLLLGINKQLDLQSAMTESARWLLHQTGQYQLKDKLQRGFIIGVLVMGALVLTLAAWVMRHDLASVAVSLTGLVVTVCFVAIRAASFHKFDLFIGRSLAGWRWNWILELGGLGLVMVGTIRRSTWRRLVTRQARQ